MLKQNGRIKWIIISIGITAIVLFASVVTTWALYGENIDDNTLAIKGAFKAVGSIKEEAKSDIDELEKEGCDPANKHKIDIALIQKDIKTIQKDVSLNRKEQQDGFKEILNRLPK